MKRSEKESSVKEISEKLNKTNSVIITEYKGLTVEKLSELRKSLRKANAEYKVYKNTLCNIAFKDHGYTETDKYFTGSTAIAFSHKEPAEVAKILADFQKANELFKIRGGYLGNKEISEKEVKVLASLPSREVLLSKVLATMQGPLYGLAYVCVGPIKNFVYAVKAIADKKSQEAQAA